MDLIQTQKTYTAFIGHQFLGTGTREQIALLAKAAYVTSPHASILCFDDETGQEVDFNLQGSDAEIIARLSTQFPASGGVSEQAHQPIAAAPTSRGRGRPKLGVISREISLLPRHWEWLDRQQSSPSATLRKLIDAARHQYNQREEQQRARKASYLFLTAIAGNHQNYEELIRSLFAGDALGFLQLLATFPNDIHAHAKRLSENAFSTPSV